MSKSIVFRNNENEILSREIRWTHTEDGGTRDWYSFLGDSWDKDSKMNPVKVSNKQAYYLAKAQKSLDEAMESRSSDAKKYEKDPKSFENNWRYGSRFHPEPYASTPMLFKETNEDVQELKWLDDRFARYSVNGIVSPYIKWLNSGMDILDNAVNLKGDNQSILSTDDGMYMYRNVVKNLEILNSEIRLGSEIQDVFIKDSNFQLRKSDNLYVEATNCKILFGKDGVVKLKTNIDFFETKKIDVIDCEIIASDLGRDLTIYSDETMSLNGITIYLLSDGGDYKISSDMIKNKTLILK